MTTQTIHPPTSRAAHAGPPGSSPDENITVLRQALADTDDLRRVAERHEAMELVLRNALHARNELTAQLGLRLVRAEEALADLAQQSYRLERENARLSGENRALRDAAVARSRGRHRRRSP